MKKKLYLILISCIVLFGLFITHLFLTNNRNAYIILENIEALSAGELPDSPCKATGGYCTTGSMILPGVHFAED